MKRIFPIFILALLGFISCSQESPVPTKDVTFLIKCPQQNTLQFTDMMGKSVMSTQTLTFTDSCYVSLSMQYGQHTLLLEMGTASGRLPLSVSDSTLSAYTITANFKTSIDVDTTWGEPIIHEW